MISDIGLVSLKYQNIQYLDQYCFEVIGSFYGTYSSTLNYKA